MHVQNGIRKCVDEARTQETHEARKAHERHAASFERVRDCLIERLAIRKRTMRQDQRLDARALRALEPLRVCAVGDDEAYCRVEAAVSDGVDDRLKVAAAAGNQDAENGGH